MILPKGIIPAKKPLKWLFLSILFFIVFSMFMLNILVYFGAAFPVKMSGRSTLPDFLSIPIFGMFCYGAFIWRYTFPEKYYTYKKNASGQLTLSFGIHVVSTATSILCISACTYFLSSGYTFYYRSNGFLRFNDSAIWTLIFIVLMAIFFGFSKIIKLKK
jgi:hypothetical protein